jgi:hypothetical protein
MKVLIKLKNGELEQGRPWGQKTKDFFLNNSVQNPGWRFE